LWHFHEVESAGWDVLEDAAEVRFLARFRFTRVDAVIVLASLVRGTVLILLAFTLKANQIQLYYRDLYINIRSAKSNAVL
jgi:hypothetical protein